MTETETVSRSRIASRVLGLKPSGIRKFFELVVGRPDVLSLGVGEPDYASPWAVREQGIYSLEKGETSYTSNQGILSFRKGIARWLEGEFTVSYDPHTEILVTVGVSEALDLACRALLEPGDEVLIPEPCFVSYPALVELAGGVPVQAPTSIDTDFLPTLSDLEAKCSDRTRVLLLNFPNNPTGAVFEVDHLRQIADWSIKRDLIVLSDEIYSPLTYEGRHTSMASLPGMKERTVLLHGLSKGWAMTGWRIGYAAAPADICSAMCKIHQYQIMCAPITGQVAGMEALQRCEEDVVRMREDYSRRRRVITKGFNEIGLPCHLPGGAFYVFPSIKSTGLSSEEFAYRLLEQENVAVVPGNAFGESGEGYVRCCYATALDVIEEALERIGRFVRTLR